jgi:hypothetical protein
LEVGRDLIVGNLGLLSADLDGGVGLVGALGTVEVVEDLGGKVGEEGGQIRHRLLSSRS